MGDINAKQNRSVNKEEQQQDLVWKALSDPTRRSILDSLKDGARTTGDLCEQFPKMGRTGVMKHLDILQRAGLIEVRREGRTRWNSLNPIPIRRIYERWIHPHVGQMASGALRLKRIVESKNTSENKGDKNE